MTQRGLSVLAAMAVVIPSFMVIFIAFEGGLIHMRSKGICFAGCDRAREEEFSRLYLYWFQSQNECGVDPELHFDLLTRMAPFAASRLQASNETLTQLAAREAEGSLSVADREAALNNWGRYEPPTSGRASSTQLLYHCPHDGFTERGDRRFRRHGFCFGYAFLGFTEGTPMHSGPVVRYGELVNRLYRHHVAAKDIEKVISDMRVSLRSDQNLESAARDLVLNLPASDVAPGLVKDAIRKAYLDLKCGLNSN